MAITTITVTNDDGTTEIFVPQGSQIFREIQVPLNTPIKLLAETPIDLPATV